MIFISYAQKDGLEYAKRLESALQAAGFETWRDEPDIHPASGIDVAIEDAILQAESVVVCVTKDVQRTDSFVRREIPYAEALKKPIIVIRFEDVLPPITVFNRKWLNFFKMKAWKKEGIEQLADWLRRPLEEREKFIDDPSKPADSRPSDPFRPYLESALTFIVEGLRQRIIVPIDLRVGDTPDAVNIPVRKRNVFEQAFSGNKLETGAEKLERHQFKTFREGFEEYNGRVLLLGEPGAGKTITLMAYARDSYSARLENSTNLLPLFNLVPTWDAEKQTPLHEWIAETHDLEAQTVKDEIDAGRTLLLLDGLDELGREREEYQKNRDEDGNETTVTVKYDPRLRFLQTLETLPINNHLLLTSRIWEYDEIGYRAALNGAITLRPLDDDQMGDYLRDQPELRELLKNDEQLRNLTRAPLLLSIFAYAYHDLPESEGHQLLTSRNAYELREKIFMRYIEQRYKHESEKVNADLAFTLQEMKDVLKRVATKSVIDSGVEGNVLYEFDSRVVSPEQAGAFTQLAMQLNLLTRGDDERLRFIHLLLRNTLAFELLLKALGNADRSVYRITDLLGEIGDPRAVKSLIHVLRNDASPGIRGSAAHALGEIGDVRAIEPLIIALTNDESVRHVVKTALVKIGTPTVEPLINALATDNADVRKCAAEALGSIRDFRSVKPLIAVMNDNNVLVRRSALDSLGKIDDVRAVEPLIIALTDDDLYEYIDQVADILVSFGEDAVNPLIANLTNDNPEIRLAIVNILGKIGDVRALIAILTNSDPKVRWTAANILGKIGDVRAVEPLIIALTDDHSEVRFTAAHSLGKFNDARAIEPLIAALNDSTYIVRYTAADILGEFRDVRAVEPLIAAFNDFNVDVRQDVARALAKIGDARAVDALSQALNDSDADVRLYSVQALANIGDARAVDALSQALYHSDTRVSWDAEKSLEQIGTPEAWEAIIAWWQH